MYIFLLGYHVTGIHSSDEIQTFSGADPGFFLGGGALISCSTSTPINHIVFFLQNTSCIRKPQVISRGRGGCCAPPAPSPYIRPCCRYRNVNYENEDQAVCLLLHLGLISFPLVLLIRCWRWFFDMHAPSPLFTQYTYHDGVFTPLKNRLQVHPRENEFGTTWTEKRRASRLRTRIKNISV